MNVVKNLPALVKILGSLPGLHTLKKQIDAPQSAPPRRSGAII